MWPFKKKIPKIVKKDFEIKKTKYRLDMINNTSIEVTLKDYITPKNEGYKLETSLSLLEWRIQQCWVMDNINYKYVVHFTPMDCSIVECVNKEWLEW